MPTMVYINIYTAKNTIKLIGKIKLKLAALYKLLSYGICTCNTKFSVYNMENTNGQSNNKFNEYNWIKLDKKVK